MVLEPALLLVPSGWGPWLPQRVAQALLCPPEEVDRAHATPWPGLSGAPQALWMQAEPRACSALGEGSDSYLCGHHSTHGDSKLCLGATPQISPGHMLSLGWQLQIGVLRQACWRATVCSSPHHLLRKMASEALWDLSLFADLPGST